MSFCKRMVLAGSSSTPEGAGGINGTTSTLSGYQGKCIAALQMIQDGPEALDLTAWSMNLVTGLFNTLVETVTRAAEPWPLGPMSLQVTNPEGTAATIRVCECNTPGSLAVLAEMASDAGEGVSGELTSVYTLTIPAASTIREVLHPASPFLVLLADNATSGLQITLNSLTTIRRGPARMGVTTYAVSDYKVSL